MKTYSLSLFALVGACLVSVAAVNASEMIRESVVPQLHRACQDDARRDVIENWFEQSVTSDDVQKLANMLNVEVVSKRDAVLKALEAVQLDNADVQAWMLETFSQEEIAALTAILNA